MRVDTIPRRVFLSHTSELARLPTGRTFVDAAESAVNRSHDAVVDMAYFGPRADQPAEVCIREVKGSDVYVGIIGFRYGSLVRDRKGLSYTELEFDEASAAGKPRLLMLLSEDVAGDELFGDPEYGDRQRAFRTRLMAADVTRVMITTPDQLATELLTGLMNLPAPGRGPEARGIREFPARTPVFTGRAEVIEQIHATFGTGQRICAVSGMGGIGKTVTVIEYCERHGGDYDIVWWVPAEEPALVPDRLAGLSRALNVASDTETVASAVSRLRTELALRRRWLIIFDNAENSAALAQYLMPGPGHTLITSRDPSWEDLATSISMKVLGRSESIELVKKRLPLMDDHDADRIASALGDLPLALSQTAAYLADTGMSVDGYVDLLASRATDTLSEAKPGNYPEPLAAELGIAFEAIAADRPPAIELLTLAAFMAPEPIPLTLLAGQSAALPTSLAAAARDPLAFASLTRLLRQRGLAQIGMGSMQVHRLVQALLRERAGRAEDGSRERWIQAAVELVNHAFPCSFEELADPRQWRRSAELLPHALVTTGRAEQAGAAEATAANLLRCSGSYLERRGDYTAARDLLERSVTLIEAARGPDHLEVAYALNALGFLLQDQGELDAAGRAHERALAIDEARLEPDHGDIGRTLNDLGRVRYLQGNLLDAHRYLDRALAVSRAAFGPRHPEVASALNNLGQVLRCEGDLTGARDAHQCALAIKEAAPCFGPDSPSVGSTLNYLGVVLRDLGELPAARDAHQRALAIFEACLPPDHPDIATSRKHLTAVLQALEEQEEQDD